MTVRKKNISLKPGKSREGLSITHPNAAGIDIGSATHFVAVPPDRDDEPGQEHPAHAEGSDQMNIQLANVISDVAGETGLKILRAILAGERDGQALADMRNSRIQASAEEIAKSLQGNWRAEHLFALMQALASFDFLGTQLAEVDHELEKQLQVLKTGDGEPGKKAKKRGRTRNAPKFNLRTQLFRVCGVDLTRIDWIDSTTAMAVISETGTDMTRFPKVGNFNRWMGLCPGTKITGGKVMSGKTKRCANRDPQALRLAAATCAPANRPSAPTTGECARAWTSPRPSPPRHTSSPG